MATLNKVLLIGRLTNNPEARTFSNGGKVAKFGFAVNDRKKNAQTGEWEEVPTFIDVEAFDRKENELGSRAEKYFKKGMPLFLEGRLRLDQWSGKDGSKRSKLLVILERFEFLDQFGGKKSAEQTTAHEGNGEEEIPF